MSHQISWKDDEVCGVSWCNGVRLPDDQQFSISIYSYTECPRCKMPLKLRQINEIVEKYETETCGLCQGDGTTPFSDEPCEGCDGRGEIILNQEKKSNGI